MKFADTPKITVAIRKRPLNKKELQRNQTDIVRVGVNGQVTISEHKQKVDLTKYLEETTFNFDYAFDESSTNEQIYMQSIHPLIRNAFMGAKISCFAYGQTGSGKTHTMKGDINKNIPGLYYLGAKEIFTYLEQPQFRHLHATISFYEIYCGRLYDLLNSRAELKIREDKKQNINVIGMEEKVICSANEFLDIIEYGSNFRVTSQNATNSESSRSHAILQITLKHQKKAFTKISFIDLAGNERGADHIDQNKQTKIDGAEINKSLLSLKECIRALDQGKGHTPFRGSKLTMVLKDSFVGFCNTVMICNVSPNSTSSENTMNTLRYADRVKQLKSNQGEILSKEQILARELMLPRANNKNCIKVNIENNDDEEDILLKVEEARNQGTQGIKNNYDFEEKMDIEEPVENKKIFLGNSARKSDNMISQMKLFGMAQKKGQLNKEVRSNRIDNFSNNLRGKGHSESEKPLNPRNVRPIQIDQNNSNFGNNSTQEYEITKRHFIKPQGRQAPNPIEVNRAKQVIGSLKRDFNLFCEDHEVLLNSEMNILKEEMNAKEEHRLAVVNNGREEDIEDISNYLDFMEQCVRQKLEIFNQMQSNLEKMRTAAKGADILTKKARQEQIHHNQHQGNFFMNSESTSNLGHSLNVCRNQARQGHSSMSGLHFNDFNSYHQPQYVDEQLLEGLPGDQSMARLF